MAKSTKELKGIDTAKHAALGDALKELTNTASAYALDRDPLLDAIADFCAKVCKKLPDHNKGLHAARKLFDPIAEELRGLPQIQGMYQRTRRQ